MHRAPDPTQPDPAGTDPGPGKIGYLGHLTHDSARFAQVLAQAPLNQQVPTCPAWDADDLLWHLTQVQWFWGTIVSRGLTSDAEVEALVRPTRPGDHIQLLAQFNRVSSDLLASLCAASPDTPAWTWSDQHTVGFIRRRQAHEALIHRLDAELTCGARSPMDAHLSTDGIDEALGLKRLQLGTTAGSGPRRAALDLTRTVALRTTDTSRSWLVTLGPHPGTGTDRAAGDEPALVVGAVGRTRSAAREPAAATLSGSAADLDCLLWQRPAMGRIERTGDPLILELLDEVIAADMS